MLDPVTLSAAVAGANAAYSAVKKAVTLSKDFREVSGEIGKWMSAVSDVDNIHKKSNSPSALDKIFNGSIEEVALNSFAAKKKITQQREELKNYIIGNFGTNEWDNLLREEGRIRRQRQEAIYARQEHMKQVREYGIIGIACLVGVCAVGAIVWIIALA